MQKSIAMVVLQAGISKYTYLVVRSNYPCFWTIMDDNFSDRGTKDVLKKRLKNYYRQKMLAHVQGGRKSVTQDIAFLMVIDIEATCEEQTPPTFLPEIIEFPIVLVDVKQGKVVSK